MNKIILILTIWKEMREKAQIDQKKRIEIMSMEKKLIFGERKLCETIYFTEERPTWLGSALRYQWVLERIPSASFPWWLE